MELRKEIIVVQEVSLWHRQNLYKLRLYLRATKQRNWSQQVHTFRLNVLTKNHRELIA